MPTSGTRPAGARSRARNRQYLEMNPFPEYMDALNRAPRAIHVGAMVSHAAPRLIQRSEGYVETIVAPETIVAEAELTDARPGHLVCGGTA